jgi:hypothetical protein
MNLEPPAGSRKSPATSKKVGRLYDRLIYWLYQRGDPQRARPLADQLEQVLPTVGPETGAVFSEECRALIHEARGELARAIEHRENEVRLIRRLHRLARKTASPDLVLAQYTPSDLRDRLDLLAMLYHDSGHLDQAIRLLKASGKLCTKHGISFAEDETLREYLEEKKGRHGEAEAAPPGTGSSRRARQVPYTR